MKLSEAIRTGIPLATESNHLIVDVAYRVVTGVNLRETPLWANYGGLFNYDADHPEGVQPCPVHQEVKRFFPVVNQPLPLARFWKTISRLMGRVASGAIQRKFFGNRRNREVQFQILSQDFGCTVWVVIDLLWPMIPVSILADALALHGY